MREKAHIPASLRRASAEWFGFRCAYCRSPEILVNSFFEVDHIVPESAGGNTTEDNLAYACAVCNRFKRARTLARDPLSGRTVRLYHPRNQRWERHFGWASGGRYIVGRTATGRATVLALQLNCDFQLRRRELWLTLGLAPPDWNAEFLV